MDPSPVAPRPTYLPLDEKVYFQKLNPVVRSPYGLPRGAFQLGE